MASIIKFSDSSITPPCPEHDNKEVAISDTSLGTLKEATCKEGRRRAPTKIPL